MGDVSMVCKGQAEVNNKFLKPCYANTLTMYIIYLATTNLYGHSMI